MTGNLKILFVTLYLNEYVCIRG